MSLMTVSLHTKPGPETMSLSELASFVGKEVRVIIVEEPLDRDPPDFSALKKLAGNIDLDFTAVEDLRRRSVL